MDKQYDRDIIYNAMQNSVGSWSILIGEKAVAYSFSEGMANRICRLLNSEGY